MSLRCSFVFLVLAACAAAPIAEPSAAPDGWQAVAEAAEGEFLVIGEMHGTAEIPAAFGDYVSAVAERGGRTLVGLEVDPAYQAAFDAARAAGDARAALLEGMEDHWRSQDGRGSEAMLDLFARLTSMRGVDVVFFDRPLVMPSFDTQAEMQAWYDSLSQGERHQAREERMAAELNEAFHGYDRAIVLTGNIHAAETRFEFLDDADNMAMLLLGDPVTLDNRYDSGTFYNAMHGESVREAGQNTGGMPGDVPAPAMGLTEAFGPRYDGYFYVGPITASLPAADDATTP